MQGYITIDPDSGPKNSYQIRAHCRAKSLEHCNVTKLWDVYRKDIPATMKQAEQALTQAGATTIKTTDMRK